MNKDLEKRLIKEIEKQGFNSKDVVLTTQQVEHFTKTGKLNIALGKNSLLPKNYKDFGENNLGQRIGEGGSPAEW